MADLTPTTPAEDRRRALPIKIDWSPGDGIGRITVGGEYWAGVEWSEKRQAWCIEDAGGGCLRHEASIHGQAHSKRAAVALAREMIRDGRMPSPEEAWREARRGIAERRDKRRQQPAQIRKREERQRLDAACAETGRAEWKARWADNAELPLLEALAEAFDFTDPDLWKSNSWAVLRPRLRIYQRAVVARLESALATAIRNAEAGIFSLHATAAQRREMLARRRQDGNVAAREIEAKLDRAREVLRALEGDPNREDHNEPDD